MATACVASSTAAPGPLTHAKATACDALKLVEGVAGLCAPTADKDGAPLLSELQLERQATLPYPDCERGSTTPDRDPTASSTSSPGTPSYAAPGLCHSATAPIEAISNAIKGLSTGSPEDGEDLLQEPNVPGPDWSDSDEPLLKDNPDRFCMFPIQSSKLFSMYKKAVASFWTCEEVDLAMDFIDWAKLSSNEQRFIKFVLAFFAASDGIVVENLAARFMKEVQLPEARAFYGFQIAIENIHSEMYSLLLENYVKDPVERRHLFRAIHTIPCITKKAVWAQSWISSDRSFAERLVAFACVEGIHFSSSFCAIFWLKKRLLMPGLSFSNVLISRDEGLHCDFACELYSLLRRRLPQETVHRIVSEAVELECEFCCDALSVGLVGMNTDLMAQYVKFVSDRLLVALGYAKLYNVSNPFDWMEMLSLENKANFFERRVGEYQRAHVCAMKDTGYDFSQFVFTTEEDF